jgi:hypothetical protein
MVVEVIPITSEQSVPVRASICGPAGPDDPITSADLPTCRPQSCRRLLRRVRHVHARPDRREPRTPRGLIQRSAGGAGLGQARRLTGRADWEIAAADYLESTLIDVIDTALAAQNAVVVAESLGVCSVFACAIRHRHDEVAAELALPPHAVATADAHIVAYDETLASYNARFGLPGNRSERVIGRLKGPESMAARHRLRKAFERLGLRSR